jgi:hypothetical protein
MSDVDPLLTASDAPVHDVPPSDAYAHMEIPEWFTAHSLPKQQSEEESEEQSPVASHASQGSAPPSNTYPLYDASTMNNNAVPPSTVQPAQTIQSPTGNAVTSGKPPSSTGVIMRNPSAIPTASPSLPPTTLLSVSTGQPPLDNTTVTAVQSESIPDTNVTSMGDAFGEENHSTLPSVQSNSSPNLPFVQARIAESSMMEQLESVMCMHQKQHALNSFSY